MTSSLSAQLRTGRIAVEVAQSAVAPDALFGFAERRNPKRAFLFVSRLLGRHIPVRPAAMAQSYAQLAALLPAAEMAGPVLVIGMAETAVALGAGVHRALAGRRGDAGLAGDCIYLPTTRYPLGSPLLAEFQEEHSHAPAQLLHWPVDPGLRAAVAGARTLVLVDDEASTGKTFLNLVLALRAAGLAAVEAVHLVTLTDWSAGAAAGAVAAATGLPVHMHALLSGSYRWEADPAAAPPQMPESHSFRGPAATLDPAADWGRLGRAVPLAAPELPADLPLDGRILVVGTGEYVWPPFLLAERMEAVGADVHVGAVTRSPIAPGHAIGCAIACGDNYGQGLPNFLYNVRRSDWDRILMVAETPAAGLDPALLDALQPVLLCPPYSVSETAA